MGNQSAKKESNNYISDLPSEMFEEIGKYLSNSEIIRLGLTSNKMIDKYNNDYHLFKKITFQISTPQGFEDLAKSKLNYKMLIIFNMSDGCKSKVAEKKLKFVRTIQIIYAGWNATELISLLERAENLKELHLNMNSIVYDKHTFSVFKLITNVLKLKELHISYATFSRLHHNVRLLNTNNTITRLLFYGNLVELVHVAQFARKLKALRTIVFNFRHFLTTNETEIIEKEITAINPCIKLEFPTLITRNFLK